MRMYLGEHVWTSDGQDAGTIDKVIADPKNGRVTTVVLREGQLLHHDVEVAIEQLVDGPDGRLHVDFPLTTLRDLPRFEPGSYTTPPSEVNLPDMYPQGSVLWPSGWIGEPVPVTQPPYHNPAVQEEITSRLYQQDLGNALIEPGSGIYSYDNHKVGELDRLSFERDGCLASLLVRQGILFPREFDLPGSLVDSAADGKIYLKLVRSKVEELIQQEREGGPGTRQAGE